MSPFLLGNINVFELSTGAYLGQLEQPNGTPIAITGLWDLEFGDGTPRGGKNNELFFDAEPDVSVATNKDASFVLITSQDCGISIAAKVTPGCGRL